jgi:hypothetical protein
MIKRRNIVSDQALEDLFNLNPGLFYAVELHEKMDSRKRAVVQSMLLAGQNDMEICKTYGGIPEAIQWYEGLFFNVRDRLEANNWIQDTVILPGYLNNFNEPPEHMMLKFFGYYGGPVLLDFMISGFKRGLNIPTSPEDLDLYMDKHFYTGIRRKSAMHVNTFEVNKYNVIELFNTHCRIIEIEKSAESADEARGAMEKNILVMLQELPWAVGKKPGEDTNPRLAVYEDAAGELTDEEMMLVAAGKETDEIKEVLEMELPPPRRDLTNDNTTNQGDGEANP